MCGKTHMETYIQKTKIMASGPITSWHIDGGTMGTVRDFISGGSKITANGDCSDEIERLLLLAGKAMTNLGNIGNPKMSTITGPQNTQWSITQPLKRIHLNQF